MIVVVVEVNAKIRGSICYCFSWAGRWIARSALETESVGSNPGQGEGFFSGLFFFFFILTSLSDMHGNNPQP